jgi:hypothetical protein
MLLLILNGSEKVNQSVIPIFQTQNEPALYKDLYGLGGSQVKTNWCLQQLLLTIFLFALSGEK